MGIHTTGVVRDIPLNKLVPSKINVRQTGRDTNVEELAASVLAHGLLQTLTVRAEVDGDNRETGKYEVIAGGRRLSALKLLVTRKKIAKTAPVSCLIREDGSARELSLVENVQRVNLHPADQFEAFRALHENEGLGAEEIAARFGVTARIVRERLKLAAVSPVLIDKYRAGDLMLDQIMAFAVVDDPKRQEEVWENLGYDTSPQAIRRALLSGHVPADDKRVRFVGLAAYDAAGGAVLRDLFSDDDGGYLTDPGLLDRLARQKLESAAEAVRAEGWKWVEIAPDFPHAHGMRRIYPTDVPLSDDDAHRLEAIEAELDRLGAESEADETSDPVREAKMAELNAAYDAIDAKGRVFEPEDLARAGAILSIGYEGEVSIVRGLILPDDEPETVSEQDGSGTGDTANATADTADDRTDLPDRLVTELRAQQTIALRDRLGLLPDIAQVVLTHALALEGFFYRDRGQSPLDLVPTSVALEHYAPDIGESVAARNIAARHDAWAARLPKKSEDLWDFVVVLDGSERSALLAHCVSLLVNVVHGRQHAADRLSTLTDLEMGQYWKPTASNYFTRIPKASILEAVQEGVSAAAAERLRAAKKTEMAKAAEEWLSETNWLPVLLRGCPTATETTEQAAE